MIGWRSTNLILKSSIHDIHTSYSKSAIPAHTRQYREQHIRSSDRSNDSILPDQSIHNRQSFVRRSNDGISPIQAYRRARDDVGIITKQSGLSLGDHTPPTVAVVREHFSTTEKTSNRLVRPTPKRQAWWVRPTSNRVIDTNPMVDLSFPWGGLTQLLVFNDSISCPYITLIFLIEPISRPFRGIVLSCVVKLSYDTKY